MDRPATVSSDVPERKVEQKLRARDRTGESGSSASFPMADADAPRRPLITARLFIADICSVILPVLSKGFGAVRVLSEGR
jgi:hypothetical protein